MNRPASTHPLIPFATALALALASVVPAQSPGDAVVPEGEFIGRSVYGDRLWVKLAEGTGAVLQDGVLRSRKGADLTAAAELFARGRAERLIEAPLHVLDRWHSHAHAVLPNDKVKPGHLALWFRVWTETAAAATGLQTELLACPQIESCELEPIVYSCGVAGPDDPPPPTPLFTAMQVYMDPPPVGVGSRFAQGILGARGRRIVMTVVEVDWAMGHEDLSKIKAGVFVGVPPTGTTTGVNHGLAGAGLLTGDRNAFGINGMVDEVILKLVSHHQNGAVPNSLVLAALHSNPGDVVMSIDSVWLLQLGINDYVPGEYYQATFDTILTLTANGWFVVNAAANGSRSLDDPRLHQRFDLSYRDSGAIMASATDGTNLWRAPYTNYGSRVDANGQGELVTTTGYGTLFNGGTPPLQSYTGAYSGNSAATPIITSTVTALLGAARKQLERQLTWQEVRQLLRTHGSPTPDMIGNRPDLRAMFTTLGILDGLEMTAPDVALGGSVDALIDGPVGGGALLLTSFDLTETDLGYNRKLHLGFASLVTVGYLPLTLGSNSYRFTVPNSAVLSGTDLFLQAVTLDASGSSVHITNSGQVTVY